MSTNDATADTTRTTAATTHAPAAETPPRRLVVALDGPTASGKSSVGSAAAAAFGYRFVDTGLFYRAIAAVAMRRGVPPEDTMALVELAAAISLVPDARGVYAGVQLDGEEIGEALQDSAVDANVSAYARVPEVRDALLTRQRELAASGGVILAGRDIGTVVLPDADLKLYLDASVDERADRRIAERGLDAATPEAHEVRAALRARDAQDRSREVAPLRPADEARHIHTDGNRFEDTLAHVLAAMREAASEPAHRASGPLPPSADAHPPIKPPAVEPAPVASPLSRIRARPAGAPEVDNSLSMLVRMVSLVSRIGASLFARIEVEGLERIPRTGAVILASNHISNGDPVILGAWITPGLKRRRIHWLGKKELFDWPIFGWIASHGGVHPVDRGTADVEAYRLATRILEAGWVLLMFPEGTRSPTGELQEARDGLATLAMRTGATVLPIGINNTDAVWPKGRTFPLPFPRRRVHVRIGDPFLAADLIPPGTDRRAAKGLATRAIMGRIAELLEPRHRGVYADTIREPASVEV